MAKKLPAPAPRHAPAAPSADSLAQNAFVAGAPAKRTGASKASSAPGAPGASSPGPGRRKLVPRSNGQPVRRLVAYSPPDLAKRLAVHCALEDLDASGAIVEAVRRMLEAAGR